MTDVNGAGSNLIIKEQRQRDVTQTALNTQLKNVQVVRKVSVTVVLKVRVTGAGHGKMRRRKIPKMPFAGASLFKLE